MEIPEMQALLEHICEKRYEHPWAANRSQGSHTVAEAFSRHMGWSLYHHAA